MKAVTKLLLILLALSILLSCVSCDFSTDTDGEPQGQADDGQTEDTPPSSDPQPTSKKLELFSSNLEAKFRFVVASDSGAAITKEVTKLIKRLRELGATVDDYILDTDPDAVTSCEILIGANVQNRGEACCVSTDGLALNDYFVKIVGDRILVVGGSDAATISALEDLSISGFGVDEESEEIGRTSVKRTFEQKYQQITSVKVGENDLSDYTIVYCDSGSKIPQTLKRYAEKVAKAFREICGVSMSVVAESENTNPEKVFRIGSGNGGSTGFRVYTFGDEIRMECRYENTFERSINAFIEEDMSKWDGDVVFASNTVYTQPANELYYSEFGASGDGTVDDFDAICRTHEAANLTGQTVVADGEKYYIGVTSKNCIVRTNVDWRDAAFTIDDTYVDNSHRGYWIFSVESDYAPKSYSAEELEGLTLKKGDTKINMTFDSSVMLIPVYTGHKVYVRYGINENDGTDCTEVLLVDKDGNIDSSTPVLWDYDRLDSLTAYRLDDTPLTIRGGVFTTIANRHDREYTYYNRGIQVSRANTTVENVEHYIRGEGENGAPYTAFILATKTNNVLIKNCKVTGHKTYKLATNASNSMGTYDLESTYANAITWDGISQANSITDQTYWGVHASNFCKNLTLKNSVISRFDAHQGMWNATVVNTTLGQYLNCIGGGLLYLENVTRVCGANFIQLRGDYGSTWEGDVVIKNCKHEGYGFGSTSQPDSKIVQVNLFSLEWRNWDFGYDCYMPQNVRIEGFECKDCTFFLYFFSTVETPAPLNAYERPQSVSYRDIVTKGSWYLTNNEFALPTDSVTMIDLSK